LRLSFSAARDAPPHTPPLMRRQSAFADMSGQAAMMSPSARFQLFFLHSRFHFASFMLRFRRRLPLSAADFLLMLRCLLLRFSPFHEQMLLSMFSFDARCTLADKYFTHISLLPATFIFDERHFSLLLVCLFSRLSSPDMPLACRRLRCCRCSPLSRVFRRHATLDAISHYAASPARRRHFRARHATYATFTPPRRRLMPVTTPPFSPPAVTSLPFADAFR
jgi:hypothetical protein